MAGKRRFGRVRELPSGRWQARYKGPDGIDRPAPRTFDSKTSAERWLTLTEAEIISGDWTDPDAGRVLFGKYASDWIEERPGLRPKTIELYRYLLRRHDADRRRRARCVPDGFAFARPSCSAACLLSSSAMACCRSVPPCRYTVAARVVECPIRSISSRRFAPASAASMFPVWRRS